MSSESLGPYHLIKHYPVSLRVQKKCFVDLYYFLLVTVHLYSCAIDICAVVFSLVSTE